MLACPATLAWLDVRSHRRLRAAAPAARDHVDAWAPRPALGPRGLARLRELTVAVSLRVYWFLLSRATGLALRALRRYVWLVDFRASAVQPTLGLGDHAALLVLTRRPGGGGA